MKLIISDTSKALAVAAAADIAAALNAAVSKSGSARMVLSTGASQLEMFEELIKAPVDWSCVEMFHLDEYIGIPETHPASFRKYLKERFASKVPLKAAYFVDGTPEGIRTISEKLCEREVDLGVIGIGENGHIAFNDPPADFETKDAYIVVNLDERCRRQQVGEGWFNGLEDVPKQAVSMTPYRIMQCKKIISVVPYAVKAEAVLNTLENDVTPDIPATLMKTHPDWTLYIDRDSASLLKK
ncbi:MAG: glucosamine-6-phosphate deaminase [Clostridiales bacterium]|nr:glucosamine-6-phosphate deaminase [Clostridiales bacterium]